jgi:magnesium transporter
VAPKLRVQDAINEIRRRADEAETIDAVFVIEQPDHLVGVLPMRQMLLAEPTERIDDVMIQNVISVPPELDQEEVARKLAKYDLNSIPVVNENGRMLGVITSDDILDVLTEEQSEDVHKMGAVEPIRREYFDTTLGTFVQKRAPWLVVLFFGGFLTASAMRAYNSVLAAVAELSFYVPLLISAGGNSGAQSSTLIIRGLAMGDIRTADWWRVFVRELVQGLVLGGMLAAFGFVRALLAGDGPVFAVLIAVTIIGIVIMGCVVGAMMPIFLHRLGIDPATSSTPFIATLIDVLGILLYLSLARLMLADLMMRLPTPG